MKIVVTLHRLNPMAGESHPALRKEAEVEAPADGARMLSATYDSQIHTTGVERLIVLWAVDD